MSNHLLFSEISMTHGQPLVLPSGDESLSLPDLISDELLSNQVGKPNRQPEDVPTVIEYYIQSIKLYDILRQILTKEVPNTNNSITTESPTQRILRLHTKIMAWHANLPEYLTYKPLMAECSSTQAVGYEDLETTKLVLDLPALSQRLHCRYEEFLDLPTKIELMKCRFLHVTQLILRPALELVFDSQQSIQGAKKGTSLEERLQSSMQSDIASQCVLSAGSFVEFLEFHIRAQHFSAWWLNIGCKYFQN